MRLRILSLILILALLCGCTTAVPSPTVPTNPPSADEVAQAVLDVCEDVETEAVTGDELQLWLTEFYRLPEGSWDDAAVYRAADPMYAFEVAVIRLSGKANDMEVMYCLEDYQYDREGDFTGYDPEQAKLVSDGLVCCSENVQFVALLICEGPAKAAAALSKAAARSADPLYIPIDYVRNTAELAEDIIVYCKLGEAQLLSDGERDLWLTEFYKLPEGSWDSAGIYRSADPMSALEVAVIHLTGEVPSRQIATCLENYRLDRQGDFTGYDPEQADLVAQGRIVFSDKNDYVALLLCKEPQEAENAFLAIMRYQLSVGRPPRQNSPAPTLTPTPAPAPTPTPTPTPTSEPTPPPISHMMEVYDTSAILDAYRTGDESALSQYDRTILKVARSVLSFILQEDMTDLEKERAIYQWIVRHVAYDYDHYDKLGGASLDSSTPYNPLTRGKGICMGFASTFQLLADLAGLESIIVPGKAFNNREDHAWNMIRLDGEWYCLDATWDIGNSKPMFWDYFNVTSAYMKQTNHQWDYDAYPEATATDGGVR